MRTTRLNSHNSVNSIPIISVNTRNIGFFYFIAGKNNTSLNGSSQASTGVELGIMGLVIDTMIKENSRVVLVENKNIYSKIC